MQQTKKFCYKKHKLTDDYDYTSDYYDCTSDKKKDAQLKLDKETKKCFDEIKEQENGVDRNGFSEYFGYEPSALVSNLLNQNTQDLKKGLDKIKQQGIKLCTDERSSTNNKNENDRLNMILSVIDRIYHFLSINLCQANNQINSKK